MNTLCAEKRACSSFVAQTEASKMAVEAYGGVLEGCVLSFVRCPCTPTWGEIRRCAIQQYCPGRQISLLHLAMLSRNQILKEDDGLRVGCLNGFSFLGGVPREQKMLEGCLPRVIHHQVYLYRTIIEPGRGDIHRCASRRPVVHNLTAPYNSTWQHSPEIQSDCVPKLDLISQNKIQFHFL